MTITNNFDNISSSGGSITAENCQNDLKVFLQSFEQFSRSNENKLNDIKNKLEKEITARKQLSIAYDDQTCELKKINSEVELFRIEIGKLNNDKQYLKTKIQEYKNEINQLTKDKDSLYCDINQLRKQHQEALRNEQTKFQNMLTGTINITLKDLLAANARTDDGVTSVVERAVRQSVEAVLSSQTNKEYENVPGAKRPKKACEQEPNYKCLQNNPVSEPNACPMDSLDIDLSEIIFDDASPDIDIVGNNNNSSNKSSNNAINNSSNNVPINSDYISNGIIDKGRGNVDRYIYNQVHKDLSSGYLNKLFIMDSSPPKICQNIDIPNIENIDIPNIENIDIPNIENIDIPNIENIDIPNIENIDIPNIENIDIPNIENIDRSNIENMDIANIENIDKSNSIYIPDNNIDQSTTPPSLINSSNRYIHKSNTRSTSNIGDIGISSIDIDDIQILVNHISTNHTTSKQPKYDNMTIDNINNIPSNPIDNINNIPSNHIDSTIYMDSPVLPSIRDTLLGDQDKDAKTPELPRLDIASETHSGCSIVPKDSEVENTPNGKRDSVKSVGTPTESPSRSGVSLLQWANMKLAEENADAMPECFILSPISLSTQRSRMSPTKRWRNIYNGDDGMICEAVNKVKTPGSNKSITMDDVGGCAECLKWSKGIKADVVCKHTKNVKKKKKFKQSRQLLGL